MDDRDEVDRLIFAIEQIALCAELIRDGSAGKARAALILLDSLVDGMTYRRLDLLYTASTAGWTRGTGRTYPKSVRNTARMSLPTRIQLVSETTGYEPYLSQNSPLLEPDEAEVLAVAHEYRNSAYHQDTHNEAVVGDIAAALLLVAGRMVVRSQSKWSVSASRSQVTQLAVFGVEIEGGMIPLREAAETAVASIINGVTNDVLQVRERLADDLESRLEELRQTLEFVKPGRGDLDEMVRNYRGAELFGSDDELIRRQSELWELVSTRTADGDTTVTREAIREAQASVFARMEELQARVPSLSVETSLAEVEAAATTVRAAGSAASMWMAYREADKNLTELERLSTTAALDLDDAINQESDRRRGK